MTWVGAFSDHEIGRDSDWSFAAYQGLLVFRRQASADRSCPQFPDEKTAAQSRGIVGKTSTRLSWESGSLTLSP